MSVTMIGLRRLLDPDRVDAMIEPFLRVVPGSEIALVDGDGRHFAGSRALADRAPALTGMPEAALAAETGVRGLWVEGRRVANLIYRGPAAADVALALHASLEALLVQALDSREMARETLERYREINLLYRISESIGSCLDPEEIPRLELEEARGALHADVGLVLLRADDKSDDLLLKESFGDGARPERFYRAAGDLISRVYAAGRSDMANLDDTAGSPDGGPPERFSALCAPMKAEGGVIGVTVLGRFGDRQMFTAGDQKLLLALADQAGIAIERARMHRYEVERNRFEQELSVGRRIQLSLLPKACPNVPGWDIEAAYEAAEQVGGDYYDFFPLPGDRKRLGLVIGDVTGKGVPAALMMAYTRAVIRNEATGRRSPAAVLSRTNTALIRDAVSRLFLTAFYATLEIDSGTMSYASGGHDRPLWLHGASGTVTELESRSMILGAFSHVSLDERQVELEPGDSLVMYTDGVTDTRNEQNELFDLERLKSVAAANPHLTAGDLLGKITGALNQFAGRAQQADDVTLVVVRRAPN